eukprot:gene2471-3210_t
MEDLSVGEPEAKAAIDELTLCTCMGRYGTNSEGEPAFELLEVIPRIYPLLLGTKQRTQGKAANQRSTLHFFSGQVLQMLDANMGTFLGECFKVPLVTRRMQPFHKLEDRRLVRNRVIGFREYIFTQEHGAAGNAMGTSEWTFGTIFQRTLGELNVRMHYGHPDFFDGMWSLNRGSVSKASAIINMSEDMFAGLNLLRRGENSRHSDLLEYDKGREASFNAAGTFLIKISSGGVAMLRAREFHKIYGAMTINKRLSFFYGSSGFFANTTMLDLLLTVYMYAFLWLSLSALSVSDVGALNSALATEWVLNLGVVTMLPQLMEMTLEYGPVLAMIKFFGNVVAAMCFFVFHNRTISATVLNSLGNDVAKYLATGRPNSNVHFSFLSMYKMYRNTHYAVGLKLLLVFTIYVSMSKDVNKTGYLPMFFLVGTVVCWIAVPILFNPQPLWSNLKSSVVEFLGFIITVPSKPCVQKNSAFSENTLYEVGLQHACEMHSRYRFEQLLSS